MCMIFGDSSPIAPVTFRFRKRPVVSWLLPDIFPAAIAVGAAGPRTSMLAEGGELAELWAMWLA
jgi:hypothetical protein